MPRLISLSHLYDYDNNADLLWDPDNDRLILRAASMVLDKASDQGLFTDPDSPSRVWHDIIGQLVARTTGPGTPTYGAYQGNIRGYSFAASDSIDFVFHVPHDYALGTDLLMHAHWSHNGTNISGTCTWQFESTYAKGHNQANFPAEKTTSVSYDTTNLATTPQYRHRIEEAIITSDGGSATLIDRNLIEPDGLVMVRVTLTSLPTITGGNLFLHTGDIHYQSIGIGTKSRTPDFYT